MSTMTAPATLPVTHATPDAALALARKRVEQRQHLDAAEHADSAWRPMAVAIPQAVARFRMECIDCSFEFPVFSAKPRKPLCAHCNVQRVRKHAEQMRQRRARALSGGTARTRVQNDD